MDKTITCKECHNDFTLTEGEQQFFKQMGYQEPKRCKTCRTQRKQSNPGTGEKETHEPRRNESIQWIDGSTGPERDGGKPRDRNRPRRRRDRFEPDDAY